MKIGIIGAGAAGLVATWLLEKDFEVILFEQNDRLGGHAHTKYIESENKSVPIESGFEFFNDIIFPHFIKLLEILHVPINRYKANYTFYSKDHLIVIPPFVKGKMYWRGLLPKNLALLIQFKHFIIEGAKIVQKNNKTISIEEFTKTLYITKKFKNTFLYPFLASQWGCKSVEELKAFSAYDVLYWIVKNKPKGINPVNLLEITHGVSSYIDALHSQLSQAQIHTNSTISDIQYSEGKYTIITANTTYTVDHVILATNAHEAAHLLKNVDHTVKLRASLSTVTYITTRIAVHGDISFMPKNPRDWSQANIYSDGIEGYLTIYKYWKSETPLFRSWVFPDRENFKMPDPLFGLETYYHALVNPDYFKNQEVIAHYQGSHNLWLAGLYTQGIDSHESAIQSAMTIAQKLAPRAERLINLQSI